jgi:hypothetical protein
LKSKRGGIIPVFIWLEKEIEKAARLEKIIKLKSKIKEVRGLRLKELFTSYITQYIILWNFPVKVLILTFFAFFRLIPAFSGRQIKSF